MPTTFNMSDVMISYSRRDKPFVQQLEQSLRATGREIWVDWLDIAPTVDFLQEIYAGIEAANTFVFVISPDSAKSEVCGMEVEHAVKFNKRLIPVLYRNLTDDERAKLHPAVASHNWIYIREQDNFEESFKTLISGLETDIEHVQTHTKLLVLAREWDGESRRNAFLLRGEELQNAENWLLNGVNLRPEPTSLQAEYIAESRKAAARTRQIVAGAMSAALVILSLLALFAFQQSGLATDALNISNQRGTEVANRGETALAALTQVQDRENARATAQQDAANSLQQANDNATLSSNNASTAEYSLLTAIAAQDLANANLATATFAQGQAQNALATANSAQSSAEAAQATALSAQLTGEAAVGTAESAQGTAQANLETANAAQFTAQAAQSTANAALVTANAAQMTANAANVQAVIAQQTAVAAQSAANAASTDAAIKGTQAFFAQQTAAAAQKTAQYEQTRAAEARTDAENARGTAQAEQIRAAKEALNAQSLSLASEAQAALLRGERPLAMSLALMAVTMIDTPSPAVVSVLGKIASSNGERYGVQIVTGQNIEFNAVALSPDGMRLYAGVGATAYVVDISDPLSNNFGTPKDFSPGSADGSQQIAFSPDGMAVLIYNGSNFYLYENAAIPIQTKATLTPVNPIPTPLMSANLDWSLDDLAIVGSPNNRTFVLAGDSDSNNYGVEIRTFADAGNPNLNSTISLCEQTSSSKIEVKNLGIISQPNSPLISVLSENSDVSNLSALCIIIAKTDGSRDNHANMGVNWNEVVFSPQRHAFLAIEPVISTSDLKDVQLSFGIYGIASGNLTKSDTILINLNSTPQEIAFKLNTQYPDFGSAAAVAGLSNGRVSVLDLAIDDFTLTDNKDTLIDWVCTNRYWQLLSNLNDPGWPATIEAKRRKEIWDKAVEKCDIDATSTINAVTYQAASVDNAPPILNIPTPSPTATETPTPDITLTASTPDPNAPVTIDSSDAQVSLNGSWQPIENPQANGGSYLLSSTADDSMGLIFEGTAISIIYFQHPAMGSFNVEIDGTMIGSVRETGDALLFRQVPITGLAPGLHTIRVIPAQNPIVIDAFVVNPPINWLPGAIVTATTSPTIEITLTPTANWTYSPTPEIFSSTWTPSPIVVPTETLETWTATPTSDITETWTPSPTLETPTNTPEMTASSTVVFVETPSPSPTMIDPPIPIAITEETSG